MDHPTRQATGSGFKNGMTGMVSCGPVHWAALMLAGLFLGSGWECAGPTAGWGGSHQWGEPHFLGSHQAGLRPSQG